MIRFTVAHRMNCCSEQYWQMFLDPALCSRMYLGSLGYTLYAPVRQIPNGAQVSRTVLLEHPSPLRAEAQLLGSRFRCTEEGICDRVAGFYSFRLVPAVPADGLSLSGVVLLEPAGPGLVCRVIELEIRSEGSGNDRLIEASLESYFRKEYDKSAAFLNGARLRAAS